MAKRKKTYRFSKTRIREGMKSMTRAESSKKISDDMKKKIDNILSRKWKPINEETKSKEIKGEGIQVEVLPAEQTTEQQKEESTQRLLAHAGYGDGTAVLYDRNTLEFEERKIHQAGIYTQPKNFVTKQSYTIEQAKKVFGDHWNRISDDFENVYDENTLLRFHDTLRVDGDVNKAFLKSARFVVGPVPPEIVLDCNRSYPSEEAESYELKRINNNFVYWSIKNELARIDQNVDTYNAMITQFYQARGYQRGVILIERDADTRIPISLKPLSALRCGRVFANVDTWRLEGVEYFDFTYPNNIIFAEDLLYMTNRDYAQSIASMLYGYSDIEFVSHLVELNLIINSIVLKEINRTHWAPYVFIQLLETEDEAQARDFMAKAKRGLSMVSLLPFKIDHIEPSHSGQFVVDERDMNSRNIISHTGMPNDLVSEERTSTHANLSTKLQAYNQTDVKFFRICIDQVWIPQWYGRNIMAIIKRRYRRVKMLLARKARKEGEEYEVKTDELAAMAVETPGDITKREASNMPVETENDLIIEDERKIWEINRKLQVSKIKSMVEKEIQDNGLQIDDAKKDEVMKELGLDKVEGDNKVIQPDADAYGAETDEEPFDLTSELGLDLISPSTLEFELQVLEELMQYTDYTRLPFKIKIIYKNTSFDTDIETSLSTIGLFQSEIIPKERAQENTGNEDLVEKTKEETQIKLFMAKALAPAIQEAMAKQQQLEVDAAEAGLRGKFPNPKPGKPAGEAKGGDPRANQVDLKNRINPMTKLRKKAGIQNYTPG